MKEEIKVFVKKILLRATEVRPITSFEIVMEVLDEFPGSKCSSSMIRNVINKLRQNNIPVIANRHGYYISYKEEDILKQIDSLDCRIAAIELAKRGLWDTIENIREVKYRIKRGGIENGL